MKIFTLKACVMLALSSFLFACDKDEMVADKTLDAAEISVRNGYLVFPNNSVFSKTREDLITYSKAELNEWEDQFANFKSQRAIYEKAIDVDFAHKEHLESLVMAGQKDVETIMANNEHISPYVKENKELFRFNEHGTFDLKIEGYDPYIEYFINKDGVVQVGDSIFHYSDGYIRIILDSDTNKLANISSFKESTDDPDVAVIKVSLTKFEVSDLEGMKVLATNEYCEGYTSGGGQRVKGYAVAGSRLTTDIYNQYGCGNTIMSQPTAYLKAENESKGFFGWSKQNTAELKIIGTNISYSVRVASGFNMNFIRTTDGQQLNTIIRYLHNSTTWYCGYADEYFWMTGHASFTGRHGSNCQINM